MSTPRLVVSSFLLAAWVSLTACAGPKGTASGPVVRSFDIEGVEAVDEGELKGGLYTQATSWIPLRGKRRLDEVAWRGDLRRIEAFYRARGYHGAEVVDARVEPAGEDAVRVRVRVREGPPTKVEDVQLEGLDELPPEHADAVREAVSLQAGATFDEATWGALLPALEHRLKALGYAEAKVTGEAKVDLATKGATLVIEAAPGHRYKLGGVEVVQQDPRRVEAWRVREQVEQATEPYVWYSPEAREEAQARVFDMGVFGAAQVDPGEGNPETGTIPLRVEVAEAPFHEVGAGVGFGIEQLRQEARVIGRYEHRDFLGGLRKLDLEARAGYAFIPSAYTVLRGDDAVLRAGPIGGLEAILEQPRLFHPNVRLRLESELERAVEPAYTYNGGRARIAVPWQPRTWLLIEPSYNFELYALQEGTTGLRGDAPDLLFGCEGTCVLSYLEQRIAWDRRDDPQEPTSGHYLALALQQGGGPLGGSFRYLRVVPEARGYVTVLPSRKLTFAGRVRVGSLVPIGQDDQETPIVARFFSGGDGMRGFSTQRLSPMRLVEKTSPQDAFNAEPMPVGGNGLFEGSLEARYRLTKPITLAAFVDTGFVTPERVPTRGSSFTENLLWAVGGGIRYRTPVGPVRLDLAYRLPFGPPLAVYEVTGEPLSYEPTSGCFGLGRTSADRGGAPEGVCSLHLSIGEAF